MSSTMAVLGAPRCGGPWPEEDLADVHSIRSRTAVGVKAIAVLDWPHAIYDGGGKVVLIVEPDTIEEQLGSLAQIYRSRGW
jgi:hypothetical protein